MSEIEHNKQTRLNLYSRIAGKIANASKPKFLVKFIIKVFKKKYQIDLNDFIIPKNGFKSFNNFFTRKIKPNKRPIEDGLVSPVDGSVYGHGKVDLEKGIFVKHKSFSISELLKTKVNIFKSFVVLYLSPSDYHRVHAPFDMVISEIIYVPGTLKSVREKKVLKSMELYCKNERIILNGNSEYGRFSFVFVGALMVGKIKLSFESETESNIKRACCIQKSYDKPIEISKGQELGYFEFGSSVIILLDNEKFNDLKYENKQNIKLGQNLL